MSFVVIGGTRFGITKAPLKFSQKLMDQQVLTYPHLLDEDAYQKVHLTQIWEISAIK